MLKTNNDKLMLLKLVMLIILSSYLVYIRNEWTFVPNPFVYISMGIVLLIVMMVGLYIITKKNVLANEVNDIESYDSLGDIPYISDEK